MTSYLQEQMKQLETQKEQLKKQQEVVALKIKNSKLDKEASIEHLEALIEPITHHLNMDGNMCITTFSGQTIQLTNRDIFEKGRDKAPLTILTNEKIFITLLGIIKKQDARIGELELLLRE